MRHLACLLLTLACLVVLLFWEPITTSTSAQPPALLTLPGARPTIDAAQYPSLQAALDAVPETGGMVLLPAGKFEIDAPLRIRYGDVCLSGAGAATWICNMNQDGQPAIRIIHPDAKVEGNQRAMELWRVRLTNFRVTGNPQSGSGIEAHNVNEILIDSVTVSENGGDGILLDYCYEDPRICNSLITYNKKVGLHLQGCHDILVAANQFEENQDGLHCLDGFNLCLTGNCFDDHLGRGVLIENTYGSVLSGNMIEECQSTAIVLDRDCYGITIGSNVIAHNGAGVDLQDAHGCAVSANTFTIMKKDALKIGAGSSRIAVGGNSFCDSYVGEQQVRRRQDDREAAGVVLAGATEIGFSGNVFSGLKPAALQVGQSTSRVLFSSNLIVDSSSEGEKPDDSLWGENLIRN